MPWPMREFLRISLSCLVMVGLGITFSLIALIFLTVPYIWIALIFTLVLVGATKLARATWLRAVWINLAVVVATLGVFEVYLWNLQRGIRHDVTTSNNAKYTTGNDILGTAPAKNIVARAQKYYKDELVFDVTYTIDSHGLRVAPPFDPDNFRGCILFFGGSFTFGDGVQDYETIPYRVGVFTEGKYRIFNFGFHGYGPQQMLSALEHGLVNQTIECEPKYVIYQALDRHVYRSSGNVRWARRFPRYVLHEEGGVRFAGTFADIGGTGGLLRQIQRQLYKSFIYSSFFAYGFSARDIELYAQIVDSARRYVQRNYQGAEFHVLFWNFDKHLSERVLDRLNPSALKIHLIREDILPPADYRTNYALGPHDHHPNPGTYELIAKYIASRIVK